ncbi:hypothetical protein EIP91_000608 [Steccherinum ochraceum]|uniref:Dephospho-CoA kinase n=1 Tax=Steccherinum ochraceum TaxID=92696 RepID=A0A4R0RHZ0_9APHY|nr:hypothetical protein EIP91_000608 [Steccherinum ochraceum]
MSSHGPKFWEDGRPKDGVRAEPAYTVPLEDILGTYRWVWYRASDEEETDFLKHWEDTGCLVPAHVDEGVGSDSETADEDDHPEDKDEDKEADDESDNHRKGRNPNMFILSSVTTKEVGGYGNFFYVLDTKDDNGNPFVAFEYSTGYQACSPTGGDLIAKKQVGSDQWFQLSEDEKFRLGMGDRITGADLRKRDEDRERRIPSDLKRKREGKEVGYHHLGRSLTGGIATGKSTVSTLLKAHNIPIIDADLLARQVVQPGTPALARIVQVFGEDILLPDGYLNRPKLGSIVFTDEKKRKILNGIVHPAVRKAMFWEVVRCWLRGERVCVLDVPLLVEGGLWKLVGKVIVVYCSSEIQLQRLMKRDGSSREDASSRLNSQIPIADKLQYADIVLDNSGSPQDLDSQIDSLIRKLHTQAGWSWRVSWLFPPYGLFSAASMLLWRLLRSKRRTAKQRRAARNASSK